MELYLITEEDKKDYLNQYPALKCENSIGVLYDDYMSIKCKVIAGTCTYRSSTGEKDYLNCKLLNK
ncbi:hypothetical protein [Cetobacterium sp. SF1]|uniref:hypothetical protein n=1 Tax=unclassified Cetobacterium TaxID=2630983 RepID=UPI003CED4254